MYICINKKYESKTTNYDLAVQDAIFYTNLIILILFLSCLVFISYVIYRTLQTEKKRKQYTSEMKSGDKIYFPVASGGVTGEILEVNDDDVKVVITVSKSRVYPNE